MNSIRLDKRDLILAKGAAVMTRRGYHGTGVQEIVQAAGIPKGSFYHYFASKEDFALQALEFIYQPRLQRAKELLTTTDLSIKQIAYQLRFDSPDYFSSKFKAKTGMKPSAFRPIINKASSADSE